MALPCRNRAQFDTRLSWREEARHVRVRSLVVERLTVARARLAPRAVVRSKGPTFCLVISPWGIHPGRRASVGRNDMLDTARCAVLVLHGWNLSTTVLSTRPTQTFHSCGADLHRSALPVLGWLLAKAKANRRASAVLCVVLAVLSLRTTAFRTTPSRPWLRCTRVRRRSVAAHAARTAHASLFCVSFHL